MVTDQPADIWGSVPLVVQLVACPKCHGQGWDVDMSDPGGKIWTTLCLTCGGKGAVTEEERSAANQANE